MKKIVLGLAFFVGAMTVCAQIPPVDLPIDVGAPLPRPIQFAVRAGNTPVITVTCLTNGAAYTNFGSGWTAELNYFMRDDSSAGKTITGTLAQATGIITYNTLTNSFPSHGKFFAEVYLEKGNDKLTLAQGELTVLRSPSSGSFASLSLSPRINWDIITNIGTVPWSDFDTNNLQSQITANLDAQADTNVGFQAFDDAQVNTNAGFQTLHDAQANTNSGFEVRIASNEAFDVAQGNTNAGFEVRIASNETFRITTQPATNTALQDQITANLTNQANTNTGFQALHDAQANTNAGYEARIASNETFCTITQPATNAGFETRIQEGETAFLWGNHADGGYLTAEATRYDSLDIADISLIDTNICSLTNATYAGVVTSVSYTGTTDIVRYRTYVWGFDKQNNYGTSALSVAGASVSVTAAGVVSNYFIALTTNQETILRLDGDGSSKSDVYGVFVREVTNGILTAAESVRAPVGIFEEIILNNTNLQDRLDGKASTGDMVQAQADIGELQGLTNSTVYTNTPDYTNAVALSGTALQPDAAGTWTNLSDYNNDEGFLTNAVPKPTNTWTAGHVLSSSDSGTTTYATAVGAGDFMADGSVLPSATWNFNQQALTNASLFQAGTGTFNNVLTLGGVSVLTNEALWIAALNTVIYTNTADYTNAVALAGTALQPGAAGTTTNLSDYNNDAGFITDAGVDSLNTLTDAITIQDGTNTSVRVAGQNIYVDNTYAAPVDNVFGETGAIAAAFPHYAAFYSLLRFNGTNYAGTNVFTGSGVARTATGFEFTDTDTGATNITAGAADSYDAGTRTLTWNTNAVAGGEANVAPFDVAPTDSVWGTAGQVAKTDGSSNWYWSADSTIEFGVTDSTAARGDWFAGVSNDVSILNTNTAPLPDFVDVSNRFTIVETNYTPLPDFIVVSNEHAIIVTNYTHLPDFISVSNAHAIIVTNYTHLPDFIAVSNSVDALEVPYQTFTASHTSGATNTITHADGPLVQIIASEPLTIEFTLAGYPTNGVNRVGVELWAGTNSITFDTNTISWADTPTISTNAWNSLFFRRTIDGLFTGRE